MKHTLTLVHKSDADAIYRAAPAVDAAADGKVNLEKISWYMPIVLFSDFEKSTLYKTIGSKEPFPVAYRARYCDTVVVSDSRTFNWRLTVKTLPENPDILSSDFKRIRAAVK